MIMFIRRASAFLRYMMSDTFTMPSRRAARWRVRVSAECL